MFIVLFLLSNTYNGSFYLSTWTNWWHSFQTCKIDIHQGVIKIVDDEIFYDFQLNTTQSVIVGTDREEVLARIQRGFEHQYNLYGKFKKENIKAIDYESMQVWKRLQRHIIPNEVKSY